MGTRHRAALEKINVNGQVVPVVRMGSRTFKLTEIEHAYFQALSGDFDPEVAARGLPTPGGEG